MLRISLTSAVRLSFAHIDGSVQTTPKCSQFKDQKTGVIDESPSNIDTLLVDNMYVLLLERFDLPTKSILKNVYAPSLKNV